MDAARPVFDWRSVLWSRGLGFRSCVSVLFDILADKVFRKKNEEGEGQGDNHRLWGSNVAGLRCFCLELEIVS